MPEEVVEVVLRAHEVDRMACLSDGVFQQSEPDRMSVGADPAEHDRPWRRQSHGFSPLPFGTAVTPVQDRVDTESPGRRCGWSCPPPRTEHLWYDWSFTGGTVFREALYEDPRGRLGGAGERGHRRCL
ncbi:hypothetical protein [Streptacidiphilus sp. PB12-B1b]|uniref:hypothetical protein n=1 Tax=Streptacidiphilus sp. PB12-B1b TaxID=2705012 RepID=UPI001CDC2367|nr:hypothetical protein [Streptacidiphilus sp. PB12-B1b]